MKEFNQREYQTVVLAALLHDIGKMLQRGSFGLLDTKGPHPKVSSHFIEAFREFFANYADFELLKTLAQRHHEDPRFPEELLCQHAPSKYKPLSLLISRADNYSSSERREKAESYQDFKSTPLVSIFSRIEIDKNSPEHLRYRLNRLRPEKSFPEKLDKYGDAEINEHLKKFGLEFKAFIESSPSDFDSMFTNLLTLLMKYSWCMPSNTQEEVPDVSLFDHLKTTSAIAACLYQYHSRDFRVEEIKDDTKKKFTLLVGDLSGIQNYIFNITHIGAGGVAKRLRARSFQVSMISEIISHKILHAFNLPLTNILMSSGGKFYILLPNLPDMAYKIQTLRIEADRWFYEKLNAEINLNIAIMPLSGKDFGNYGEMLKVINSLLQKAKKQTFRSVLIDNSSWNEDRAVLDVDFGEEEKLCKACRRFPGFERDEEIVCDKCEDDRNIGTKLPKAEYIAFYRDGTGDFKDFLGYSFDLVKGIGTVKPNAYLVMSIHEKPENYNLPVFIRHIANHIPISNDGQLAPMDFDNISSKSTGKETLGYLKADVDNLGALFAFGLREFGTVSRIATMSRMSDLFFSGYVQKLIEKKYPYLYTVYSGGDDLLLIGPWDAIIKFADELNREFNRFTCNNDNITLSAGIAFVKPKSPVFRSVETADNALDKSKEIEGKNSLTVFGEAVKWDKVLEIIKEAEGVKGWLEDKRLSVGFVRNLLYYSEMQKKGQLKYLPLMAYDIARNLPPVSDNNPERLWAEELKGDLNKLEYIGIIANHALMAIRGGKDE